MQLNFIERGDGISQVALVGRLDLKGQHAVDLMFHGRTAAQKQSAVVDLTQLEFIASLGMGMFIACAQSLKRNGFKMVLAGAHGHVDVALRAAGIHHAIPMVANVDEALRLIGVTEQSA